jgi:hypothetical protein
MTSSSDRRPPLAVARPSRDCGRVRCRSGISGSFRAKDRHSTPTGACGRVGCPARDRCDDNPHPPARGRVGCAAAGEGEDRAVDCNARCKVKLPPETRSRIRRKISRPACHDKRHAGQRMAKQQRGYGVGLPTVGKPQRCQLTTPTHGPAVSTDRGMVNQVRVVMPSFTRTELRSVAMPLGSS